MHPEQKTILVTGGTGFIGAYLIRLLLQKGYKVRAIRRASSNSVLLEDVNAQIEWQEADILDIVALEDAFAGVAQVFHCAAMVSFDPKDRTAMHKVNVEGTANVVNLCLHFGIEKLVHVSSIAALGRSKERPHLTESAKWANSPDNSQYAISKYLAEQEVWRGQEEGLNVAIVNPSVVVGSRQWDEGMAKFVAQVDKGLKLYPTGRSGFVDVRDVVHFMLRLMESDISGQRFILNDTNLLHRDFFALIAQHLDKPIPSIPVGPALMELAWRVEWLKSKILGQKPQVTRESGRASVSHYTYANEKSLGAFDFQYIPIAATLREMVQQYQTAKTQGLKPMILPFNT
jgi:dihydroflavonol-4-reductase